MKSRSKNAVDIPSLYEDMYAKKAAYDKARIERRHPGDEKNRPKPAHRQASTQRASRTTHHTKGGGQVGAQRDSSDAAYADIQEDYFSARHVLLIAIQKAEAEDPDAIRRKMTYLKALADAGALRPSTRVDEILYYIEGYQVNVFYGGGRHHKNSYLPSPDGIGHGHSVLETRFDGTYECIFQRKPE